MNYLFFFQSFINWIEINYTLALFLFFLFFLFYALFSLPGMFIFIIFSGYAFGIFWSYLICLISISLGSLGFFIISKYILSKFFKKYYDKYVNKINFTIKDSKLEYLIVFRLIPGPPFMLQNILLSVLDISPIKFIISTSIGISPIMLFSIIIGHKLNSISSLEDITSKNIFTFDLFLILFAVIFFVLIRIFVKKKYLSNS